jgi:hypothetical protein
MLKDFDSWTKVSDLPEGTAASADKLFKAINAAFMLTQTCARRRLSELSCACLTADGCLDSSEWQFPAYHVH